MCAYTFALNHTRNQTVSTMSNVLETLRQEAEADVQEPRAENQETSNEAVQPEVETPEAPTSENENVTPDDSGQDTENPQGTPEATAETTAKSFVSEKAARFDDFVRRTGKEDYKEFEFWQTPTADVDENELLRKYFSEQEGMSEKEIAFELNRLTVPEKDDDEFGDDFGDDEDYSEQEILRERTLRKAKSWHEGEFAKLSADGGETAPSIAQRMTVDEFNQSVIEHQKTLHQNNRTKVYETLPTIEGFEIKIPGNPQQGIAPIDVVFTPNEEMQKTLRLASEDAGTVVNQYFNDDGTLKDPKGWIQLMAKVSLNEQMIQYAVEQAVLNDRAAQDKRKRNVTPDNYQSVSSGAGNGEEEFDNWRNSKKY